MNLYDMTADFLKLQQLLEDPEIDQELVTAAIQDLEGEIEWKADGYARIIKNMEANIDAIKAEKNRLDSKKKQLENSIDRLKSNLQECMIITGKTKFKTDLFSFAIQKNGGKAPVILDVDDTSKLPDELVRIKEEPDLDAIRDLIEKEGSCQYAHLGERGESLRIK
jgi:hypothetical protein